jgi:hypothetical protein
MDTNQARSNVSAKITELNDTHRRSMSGCTITKGVSGLAPNMNEIFVRVREFDDFTEDNDPYGEHDFGCFEACDKKLFWKIDYYDESLGYWCDPLSPECRRVLTILLAEEY